jgi:hypothetical protein
MSEHMKKVTLTALAIAIIVVANCGCSSKGSEAGKAGVVQTQPGGIGNTANTLPGTK